MTGSAERPPQVVAVVPIHNGREATLRCLDSLARSTIPVGVVVIDDGSTDGSTTAINVQFPDTVILTGDGNLWWSGATNLGARRALADGASHVLALNNDCIVHESAVEALVAESAARPHHLLGSKMRFLEPSDMILTLGGQCTPHGLVYVGLFETDEGQWDHIRDATWLPGMALLIPAACFESVGFFDDRVFPQYWGDIDFVVRAREQGWGVGVVPESLVWNDRSQTGESISERPSLGDVWRLLTSRRSTLNLVENVQFHRRHHDFYTLRMLFNNYAPLGRAIRRRYLAPVKRAVVEFGGSHH
jgi:GT2 family glycosyltransferase